MRRPPGRLGKARPEGLQAAQIVRSERGSKGLPLARCFGVIVDGAQKRIAGLQFLNWRKKSAMSKGRSGSFRANSLSASDLSAMENHERRLDRTGAMRSVRKDAKGNHIPPLIYDPYGTGTGEGCLTEAHEEHIAGARVNAGAGKVARHAFIQFPTDLEVTPENEKMMLDQAVAFVNQTHGGRAVFRARLDRDEVGRHGVDVFFAPRYEKLTKRGKVREAWISLTKFGKEAAVERFGQKPLEKRNGKTGQVEAVKDKNGQPVMVDCDSKHYQGRAFQDLWFEHLRDRVGLDWVERGEKKVGSDPDRLEVEEYKVREEQKKLDALAAEIEAQQKELETVTDAVAQKKTKIEGLMARLSALSAA